MDASCACRRTPASRVFSPALPPAPASTSAGATIPRWPRTGASLLPEFSDNPGVRRARTRDIARYLLRARVLHGLKGALPEASAPQARSRPAQGSRLEFPHHLHYGFHVLHRRFRQYPVTQVENVARPRSRAFEQLVHLELDLI